MSFKNWKFILLSECMCPLDHHLKYYLNKLWQKENNNFASTENSGVIKSKRICKKFVLLHYNIKQSE